MGHAGPDDALMHHLRTCLAFICVLAAQAGVPSAVCADDLTAEAILGRMAAAYAALTTYVDDGVQQTTVIFDNGKRTIVERSFKTAFRRPGRFRLEYSEREDGQKRDRCIIWARASQVRAWCDREQEVQSPPSLGWAMGSFAGVSARLSMRVPGLLMPDQLAGASAAHGKPFVNTGATRLDDEALGSSRCYSLQMTTNGDPSRMWVEQSTCLIRRVTSSHAYIGFKTESVTDYHPRVAGPVADSLLKFDAAPVGGRTTR